MKSGDKSELSRIKIMPAEPPGEIVDPLSCGLCREVDLRKSGHWRKLICVAKRTPSLGKNAILTSVSPQLVKSLRQINRSDTC